MLGLSGISDPFQVRNQTERDCNKFAAEFLAPVAKFASLVEEQSRSTRSDTFRLIDVVSRQSLLSKHATAIRLVETGYATRDQLRKWEGMRIKLSTKEMKQEESDISGEMSGGNPHAKRLGEVGYLPVYLAKLAIEKKYIDSVDVQTGIALSLSLQEKAFALVSRRMEAAAS
jgi:hypothetical protein